LHLVTTYSVQDSSSFGGTRGKAAFSSLDHSRKKISEPIPSNRCRAKRWISKRKIRTRMSTF